MNLTISVLSLLLVVVQSGPDIDTLVTGIQKTLGTMKDYSADFEQKSTDSSNQKTTARGHLDLKRAGSTKMMRAEYQRPEERLYISDGKVVTEFTPALQLAQIMQIKESDNDLIPFMMLLGDKRLFDQFEETILSRGATLVPGQSMLKLIPRDKKLPEVELEVDPRTFLVHRLILTQPSAGREQTEYIFRNPKINQGLPSTLFEFKAPAGVEVKRVK
jgi:chaperone LolA